jgi:hydrogenase expression/formation protein HypD
MMEVDLRRFRDFAPAQALSREIRRTAAELSGRPPVQLMEVCGGHTIAIFKYGLKDLLPPESQLRMISGPGCPVCVTHNEYLDRAIALAKRPEVILTTFGDLMRVPGSHSSLLKEKAEGADIRVCYSPTDALEIARQNPAKNVVFLGIGFETTAPTIAAVAKKARLTGVSNFLVLAALKTMPNAMRALVSSGELRLDGFICPGHVTTITGEGIYSFLAREFRTPCVISGFEPLDLLQSILFLLRQLKDGRAEVENQYKRSAAPEGNPIAKALLEEVFEPSDVPWRGLGVIPGSGLSFRPEYREQDARARLPVEIEPPREHQACLCGEIMRGVKRPPECPLFAQSCTPEDPKGSCMVSEEGSCATYFKYAR